MKLFSLVLLICSMAFAQDATVSAYPHPYVAVGASLNGGGYSTFSFTGSGGLNLEKTHFVLESDGTYDTAGKSNDATYENKKGHNYSYSGDGLYRTSSGWLLGVGDIFTKTITTNYTKQATYPSAGAGKDFSHVRIQFMYYREENELTHYPELVNFTPGPGQSEVSYTCRCTSNVSGLETRFWYPSPRSAKHLFFRADLKTYWFHTTLTDPYNVALTKSQEASHSFGGSLTYQIMYRF